MTISPIQRGVPIIPRGASQYGSTRIALLEMKVGDYRELDGPNSTTIMSTVLTVAKRSHMKVITRKLNGRGIGIWRIE